MIRTAALLLPLALLAACADMDDAGTGPCQATAVQTIPLRRGSNFLVVDVRVNDTDVPMVLDTGAEKTVVTGATVSRLGLLGDPRHGTLMSGVGGEGRAESDALVSHLSLAGYDPGTGHYAVMNFSAIAGQLPIGGIVGDDVLGHFDLDLDVRKKSLVLYSVHHCSGNFLPWSVPYASIPMDETSGGRPLLPVLLNGRQFTAFLDTGSTTSTINSSAAAALGATPEVLAKDRTLSGYGGAGVDYKVMRHVFNNLTIGPVVYPAPRLSVLDRPLREADMMLGLDFWSDYHVWISFRTKRLYIDTSRLPDTRS